MTLDAVNSTQTSAEDVDAASASNESKNRNPSQADILIQIASEAFLFHTSDGTGYADVYVNDHRETWSIKSNGFKDWLMRRFFEETEGAPNSESLQSATRIIQARARFDGPEISVHLRVACHADKLYLDLGNESWQVVEIDSGGWRVVDEAPARFRRPAGMRALPIPERGGSVETLRQFLNVQTEPDFVLVVAWILAALRNRGPYPVLALSGEQGSAKSTFSALLRSLLDPNTAPLRALPREDRDLFIAANNGHLLVFDNVSNLQPWISDTLCRMATGGGFAIRQLYTDQEEILFEAVRPAILNGIEDIINRPDLADRAVFLRLRAIPEEMRRPEQELWAAFYQERPRILGALLDAVVHGLRMLPQVQLGKYPRMADFAEWATACETALWPTGTFEAAYANNRNEAVEDVIEADPVGAAVRRFMEMRDEWVGTASDLLSTLTLMVGETQRRSKSWPDTPRALSGRLRRAATFLRSIGLEISFDREGKSRARTIRISVVQGCGRPSAASAVGTDHVGSGSMEATDWWDIGADGKADDDTADATNTVRPEAPKTAKEVGADGADANSPNESRPGEYWTARL